MGNVTEKTPIPFSVMSGEGESFVVGEKSYTVKPMLVGDALKFAEDGLFIDVQLFNLGNKKAKAKLDEYLSRYCIDENNESMSIEKITTDNWNLVHLKQFVKKLVDISG